MKRNLASFFFICKYDYDHYNIICDLREGYTLNDDFTRTERPVKANFPKLQSAKVNHDSRKIFIYYLLRVF